MQGALWDFTIKLSIETRESKERAYKQWGIALLKFMCVFRYISWPLRHKPESNIFEEQPNILPHVAYSASLV